MVYESDFYTVRRPYRPTSSYSVTALSQLKKKAHQVQTVLVSKTDRLVNSELIYRPTSRTVTRLATYPDAPHHLVRVRVRPSVVLRELDRIAYKRRPQLAISAVDDFYRYESTKAKKVSNTPGHRSAFQVAKEIIDLNQKTRDIKRQARKPVAFEDEARRIRADTASLMQRARSVVPRAASVLPLDTIYSYSYGAPVPYRFSNDAYVASLLVPLRSVADTIRNVSYFSEPLKKFTGRGNLACVHYSGNKAFSNRRPLYKELSIRDDVNLLSFYAKNRLAAAGLAGENAAAGDAPAQPTAALCA